jgi:type I restriction enzyme M protein
MNYITGFMFYRYLSQQLEEYVNRDLRNDKLSYTLNDSDKVTDSYKEYSLREYGYYLQPKYS